MCGGCESACAYLDCSGARGRDQGRHGGWAAKGTEGGGKGWESRHGSLTRSRTLVTAKSFSISGTVCTKTIDTEMTTNKNDNVDTHHAIHDELGSSNSCDEEKHEHVRNAPREQGRFHPWALRVSHRILQMGHALQVQSHKRPWSEDLAVATPAVWCDGRHSCKPSPLPGVHSMRRWTDGKTLKQAKSNAPHRRLGGSAMRSLQGGKSACSQRGTNLPQLQAHRALCGLPFGSDNELRHVRLVAHPQHLVEPLYGPVGTVVKLESIQLSLPDLNGHMRWLGDETVPVRIQYLYARKWMPVQKHEILPGEFTPLATQHVAQHCPAVAPDVPLVLPRIWSKKSGIARGAAP